MFSQETQKTLIDPRVRQRVYGKLSGNIGFVLDVLQAAMNLGQVPNTPPTSRHKLNGGEKYCWAISVSKNYRLIVRAIHPNDDLTKITAIRILRIVDYH